MFNRTISFIFLDGQIAKTGSTNQTPGFTTYLVVDGNQGQVCELISFFFYHPQNRLMSWSIIDT